MMKSAISENFPTDSIDDCGCLASIFGQSTNDIILIPRGNGFDNPPSITLHNELIPSFGLINRIPLRSSRPELIEAADKCYLVQSPNRASIIRPISKERALQVVAEEQNAAQEQTASSEEASSGRKRAYEEVSVA